jgi:hypothetical protein
MPAVTLRAAVGDNKEETLTEYICDWPDCPNVAEQIVGVICELRAFAALCPEHAALLKARQRRTDR